MEKEIKASDFEPYQVVDLNKIYGGYRQFTITGNLPKGVAITANGNVTVKASEGSTGPLIDNGRIEASGKINIHGKAADNVTLVGEDISVLKTGAHCHMEATDGPINIPYIGDHNTLKASRDIYCQTAGDDLTATSGDSIKFERTLGDRGVVRGTSVTAHTCGEDCDLTATKGTVRLSRAGNGSRIFSAEPAQIVHQGSNVTLNEYFEELPVPSISVKDTVHENMVVNSITFDMGENHFIIPRKLAPHIDATPFIDAAVDAGCDVKYAPDSDELTAAYITVPEEMKTSEYNKLLALATKVNAAPSTGKTL